VVTVVITRRRHYGAVSSYYAIIIAAPAAAAAAAHTGGYWRRNVGPRVLTFSAAPAARVGFSKKSTRYDAAIPRQLKQLRLL